MIDFNSIKKGNKIKSLITNRIYIVTRIGKDSEGAFIHTKRNNEESFIFDEFHSDYLIKVKGGK